jgi:hypothetical protein
VDGALCEHLILLQEVEKFKVIGGFSGLPTPQVLLNQIFRFPLCPGHEECNDLLAIRIDFTF